MMLYYKQDVSGVQTLTILSWFQGVGEASEVGCDMCHDHVNWVMEW
jgi:hypothetical protein